MMVRNKQLINSMVIGFFLVLVMFVGSTSFFSVLAGGSRYVSTTGSDAGDCSNMSSPCQTIQYAINMSMSGDEIYVANGVYTDLASDPDPYSTDMYIGYINKSLTIRGGYDSSFNAISGSMQNPTILDAQGQGRVLYLSQYDTLGNSITVTLDGLYITGGVDYGSSGGGSGYGGAIYNMATLTISNCQIYSNTVIGSVGEAYGGDYGYGGAGGNGQGGAIINYGVLSLIQSSVFSNSAYGGAGGFGDAGGTGGGGLGGGIYNAGTLTIQDSSIDSNMINSGVGGSGMYGNGPSLSSEGGGIYNTGVITISYSSLLSNTNPAPALTLSGGGIANYGQMWLEQSRIEGNQSFSGVGVLNRGVAQIINSSVKDNIGYIISGNSGNGGGITNYGVLTVTQSTIDNNSSGIGGGIHNVDGAVAYLTNTTVTSNTAEGNGGGVSNYGGVIAIVQSTIDHNIAAWSGGALANQGSCGLLGWGTPADIGLMIVKNTTVSSNTAFQYGGGIFNESGYSSGLSECKPGFTTINNISLAYNTAITDGGGLYTRPSTVTNYAAVITMSNSIIANNHNNDCAMPVNIRSLGHNIESDGSCLLTQTTDITNTDPILGSLDNNGGSTKTHALLVGSPAIDAGGNGLCEIVDQRGVFRPQGSSCDIGSFEYAVPLLLINKFAPTYKVDDRSSITYTLTVTNMGAATATNVIITDTLPSGATYVPGSASNSGSLHSPDIVEWTMSSLAPNATVSMQFAVTATQTITNDSYAVSADGGVSARGVEAVVTQILPGVSMPVSGGTITPDNGITVTVGSNVFTDTVVLNYRPQPVTNTGTLTNVGIFYDLDASYLSTGQPAQPQPGMTYTITVAYDEASLPTGAKETDLALYYWDSSQWVKEPTSVVDAVANTIAATPDHFSLWAALVPVSTGYKIYLPLVLK